MDEMIYIIHVTKSQLACNTAPDKILLKHSAEERKSNNLINSGRIILLRFSQWRGMHVIDVMITVM